MACLAATGCAQPTVKTAGLTVHHELSAWQADNTMRKWNTACLKSIINRICKSCTACTATTILPATGAVVLHVAISPDAVSLWADRLRWHLICLEGHHWRRQPACSELSYRLSKLIGLPKALGTHHKKIPRQGRPCCTIATINSCLAPSAQRQP